MRTAILTALAATLSACSATPLVRPRQVPEVRADVYAHFRLEDPSPEGGAHPLPVLGAAETSPSTAEAGTPQPEGRPEGRPEGPGPLTLEEVLGAVETHFPLILAALDEVEIAAGQALGAQGAFDTKLKSDNLFELDGFYQSERVSLGFEQAIPWLGADFVGGYRRGSGDFAVYDGKAATNGDGEIKFGVLLPLLRDRSVDDRRVAAWKARLSEDIAEPLVLAKRLGSTRKAAASYWKWVAQGQKLRIARGLLNLALDRTEQLEAAVEEGLLAQINLVDNRRLIVEREASVIAAERGLQEAAILLSLFTRDGDGRPVVESPERLPDRFPIPRDPARVLVPDDVDLALGRRPEVRERELRLEQLELDLELARNARLADLDLGLFASQDYGKAKNDPDDKGPFELEALVRFELPLQRRKARGKERELNGKIAKLEKELRFAKDRIIVEVQDIVSELRQGYERVNRAKENVELAKELEAAERLKLLHGESDLFRVNVREQQTVKAASALVEILTDHFQALAAYRAALGVPYDEVLLGLPVGGSPVP